MHSTKKHAKVTNEKAIELNQAAAAAFSASPVSVVARAIFCCEPMVATTKANADRMQSIAEEVVASSRRTLTDAEKDEIERNEMRQLMGDLKAGQETMCQAITELQANQETMCQAIAGLQTNQETMCQAIAGLQTNQETMCQAIADMQVKQKAIKSRRHRAEKHSSYTSESGFESSSDGLYGAGSAMSFLRKRLHPDATFENGFQTPIYKHYCALYDLLGKMKTEGFSAAAIEKKQEECREVDDKKFLEDLDITRVTGLSAPEITNVRVRFECEERKKKTGNFMTPNITLEDAFCAEASAKRNVSEQMVN